MPPPRTGAFGAGLPSAASAPRRSEREARLRRLRQPSPCLCCPPPAAFATHARRNYKTPAGHDYYFDPATERIHYLSATGASNYAIDPMRNTAVLYGSLRELESKLAAGYTGEAEADSDDDADGHGESAPLSPRSKEAAHTALGTAQQGFKKSVKAIAGKRVRIAAEGGRGDAAPPAGLDEQTL